MAVSKIARPIGTLYLFYLSLLPAVGTFVLFGVLKIIVAPFAFFLIGTAGVGIYLAFVNSYTPISNRASTNLMRLIDTPAWVALTAVFGGSAAVLVVQMVLVELLGIFVGLFALSCISPLPTRDQRIGSLLASGLPLLGVAWIAYRFGHVHLTGDWIVWLILGLAVLQAAVMSFRTFQKDEVLRPAEGMIVFGILAWLAGLIGGVVLAATSV